MTDNEHATEAEAVTRANGKSAPWRAWWGPHDLAVGTTGHWQIGPLSLFVGRQEREWRVASKSTDDPMEPTVRVELPCELDDFMALDKVTRYGVSGSDPHLAITPHLADRPIISRPEKPFVVLPEDEITVYISTPLWVAVDVGTPPRRLTEIPVYRPSDTWFGPNTMEGELCYAGRTSMRLNLEQVPVRPHRAISAVTIRNHARAALTLERLNLPVVHLALYQGPENDLWTDNVLFERPADGDQVRLRLRESVGNVALKDAKRLADPRTPLPDRLSIRTLGSLFA